ncbi:hypothetical protein [Methylobacterium soli]|uniref:Uncharacterized protein n=1 Tax=Methylobacterium soli TaxID=553447 RepID=A0A6L3T1Z8_9HYPH|nr:hypothetical protein [Methylobacterium soli]KAB1080698.1 hypothetical protein F6X53_05865 [Methylobacterium soli]GJE42284.1 hypothetical protein AEGHOMDF_1456 [Methylobacterium soli]
MDDKTIAMNNEVVRIGAEHMLQQLRSEGLHYRMWVSGSERGSTIHLRIPHLTADMEARILNVLRGQGVALDIADAPAP